MSSMSVNQNRSSTPVTHTRELGRSAPPKTLEAPTETRSTQPSGFGQRQTELETQRQVVSPEVVSGVGKTATKLGPSQLQQNADELEDVHQQLQITLTKPSGTTQTLVAPLKTITLTTPDDQTTVLAGPPPNPQISPRHFKLIEDLARSGKSAGEIATILKDPSKTPGETGADRYNRSDSMNFLDVEDLTAKIAETPQFLRGHDMSVPGKLEDEIGKIKTRLKQADLDPTVRIQLQESLESKQTELNQHKDKRALLGKSAAQRLPKEIERYTRLLENTHLSQNERTHLLDRLQQAKTSLNQLHNGTRGVPSPEQRISRQPQTLRQIAKLESQLQKILNARSSSVEKGLKTLPIKQEQLAKLEAQIDSQRKAGKTSQELGGLTRQAAALRKSISHLIVEANRENLLRGQIKTLKAEAHSVYRSDMLRSDKNIFQKLYFDAVAAQGGPDKAGHGEMQWNKIKREYLGTDRREFSMRAVIDFRQEFVLLTFRDAVAEEKAKELAPLKSRLETLKSTRPSHDPDVQALEQQISDVAKSWDRIDKRAVGSTDLTSDFDMTVLGDRAGMDSKVMANINARFQQKYGTEAGNVFDTNLYVAGGGPLIKKEVQTGPKRWESPEARAHHDQGQDIAALVKHRMYSSEQDWQTFVKGVESGLKQNLAKAHPEWDPPTLKARVKSQMDRFEAADTLYQQRDNAIKEQVRELRKDPNLAGKSDFDLEITAMNRLFEKACFRADTIKVEWERMSGDTPEDLKAKDLKWAKYTREDAVAQLYANEPYFSEGPVRHVVGNEQALKGLEEVSSPTDQQPDRKVLAIRPKTVDDKLQSLQIDLSQAMESISENLGDAKKELMHLSHEGKPMGEIAIKASKYMGRLTRAIEYGLPKSEQSDKLKQTISKLQGAEIELLRIRKGGKLPDDFLPQDPDRTNKYALKVLKDNGLEHLDSAGALQKCFEDLTLEAEVAIRTKMVLAG